MVKNKKSFQRELAIVEKLTLDEIQTIATLDTKLNHDIDMYNSIVKKQLKPESAKAQIRVIKQFYNDFILNPSYQSCKFSPFKIEPTKNTVNLQNNKTNFQKYNDEFTFVPSKQKKLSKSANVYEILGQKTFTVNRTFNNYLKINISIANYERLLFVLDLYSNIIQQNMSVIKQNLTLGQIRVIVNTVDENNEEKHFSTSFVDLNNFNDCFDTILAYIYSLENENFYYDKTEIFFESINLIFR